MTNNQKPNILFTTPLFHYPPKGGPDLRMVNSIKALSQTSNLHIYSRVSEREAGQTEADAFFEEMTVSYRYSPLRTSRKFSIDKLVWKLSRKFFKKDIFSIEEKSEFKNLINYANQIQADLIWLGYGNISYPLLKYIKTNTNYKTVLDTDSVWSRFVLRGLPYAQNEIDVQRIKNEGESKKQEEAWGTKISDITLAVSEVDAEYYISIANCPEQVYLYPNVLDLNDYHEAEKETVLEAPSILVMGTFGIDPSPMEDGTRWLIDTVFPIIRKRFPNLELYIVGKNSSYAMRDFMSVPGIVITGEVDSILPYLHNAKIVVVPLRYESGTRFKILEAGACKKPVVSTSLGAEGLGLEHETHILLADNSKDFAEAIVKLLEDDLAAQEMSKRLYEVVKDNFCLNILVEQSKKIFDYLKLR
jgi:glycosyltransferase involved in cell wall biosynthesis